MWEVSEGVGDDRLMCPVDRLLACGGALLDLLVKNEELAGGVQIRGGPGCSNLWDNDI